jgi:hypothetical protein
MPATKSSSVGLEFTLPMLKILKDAEGRHDVFLPFGAIALEQIESWMRSSSLNIPRDLVEFRSPNGR